ncbi:hypothetical protein SAMN05444673_3344 [Bacillus sp. OV166]|nr:hypothetical protein SAMN05444673_3344 [Bacillus sp. OV166]
MNSVKTAIKPLTLLAREICETAADRRKGARR